ncbi:MAG: hypothetical protein WA139_03795 [Candidatus Aenigmatarchaeota archaeon]
MALIFPSIDANFIIPFLFVLAVVFGVLRISKAFKGNAAVEVIISLVIAFFSATYSPFTSMLFNILPSITMFFIAMFFIVFVLEIVGVRGNRGGNYVTNLIIYGILILVLFTIVASHSELIPNLGIISPDDLVLGVGLIFVISIFWAAFKIGAGESAGGKGK